MNQRQKFAAHLRTLSDHVLSARLAKAKADFDAARRDGYCSLEAVLYFDVKQIGTG